jgi:putative aminopeptidase FrvX
VSIPEVLASLLRAPGAPGQEAAPAAIWREAAMALGAVVSSDPMGSSVARVRGRGEGPLLAVVGHIDEIALLVSHVNDKGFLHVVGSGGWDPQVLVGQRVQVLAREGPLPGVAASRSICSRGTSARRRSSSRACMSTSARATATRRARGWPRATPW